jgi:hypothetical protein
VENSFAPERSAFAKSLKGNDAQWQSRNTDTTIFRSGIN